MPPRPAFLRCPACPREFLVDGTSWDRLRTELLTHDGDTGHLGTLTVDQVLAALRNEWEQCLKNST